MEEFLNLWRNKYLKTFLKNTQTEFLKNFLEKLLGFFYGEIPETLGGFSESIIGEICGPIYPKKNPVGIPGRTRLQRCLENALEIFLEKFP